MITDDSSGKKLRTEVETSAAQKAYRKWMGGNDQSDAKRSKIKLSEVFQAMATETSSKNIGRLHFKCVLELSSRPGLPN